MSMIDPTARIADGAVIGKDTVIGPYCVIGPNVVLGDNCNLMSHVALMGHASIGANCVISPFAVLGGAPQDLGYRGEPTRLEIGAGCTIREGVTMSVGTVKGGGLTRVGERGFFMSNSHVGHDCIVGDDVIMASAATLGGHCEVADFVYVGGMSVVHQFARLGTQAMIGGASGIRGDVIPFGFVNGQNARLEGLNVVGMKRRKFSRERLAAIRAFYLKLFHGPGLFAERVSRLQPMAGEDPAIAEILKFIADGKKRPLCLPAIDDRGQP
jgi:UDP-N-acetylglucosamine acyltransferase